METCCTACVNADHGDMIVLCDSCGVSSDEAGVQMVYCDVLLCSDCHVEECAGECDDEL